MVAAALAFDFTNGCHDTASAMATRALKPRLAVALSAVLNFAGAFVSIAVATTMAEGIVNNSEIELPVLFAGLLGAIAWGTSLPGSSGSPRARATR